MKSEMKFLSDHFDLKQIHECLSGDVPHTEILKLINLRNPYQGELMFNPIIPLSNDLNIQSDDLPRNDDMYVDNSPESSKNEPIKNNYEFLTQNFNQQNDGNIDSEQESQDKQVPINRKVSNPRNRK